MEYFRSSASLHEQIDDCVLRDVDPESGLTSVRIDDLNSELAKAVLDFEQARWDQRGYGSLEDYNMRLSQQTRLFGVFDGDDCVGSTRLFTNGSHTPPFLTQMLYSNPEEKNILLDQFSAGKVEELGTAATDNDPKYRKVAILIWRLALRDAIQRGVEKWGIIMEPRRVDVVNRLYGFNFTRLGEPVDYQGGECAAHLLDLSNPVNEATKPDLRKWFIEDPLLD